MSVAFDLVVRNGVVVTAADAQRADIGIRGGRIVALGEIRPARRDIDAAGRYVLPGGIDAHCHFDQPMRDSVALADDFLSGTISAAHGGTTTVVPFACQARGSACAPPSRTTTGAPREARIDYAFHLIISDPTEDVLARSCPR